MEEKTTSKTLGILSIIFGFLAPVVGLVLGIIGISIKKSKSNPSRDVTLNVVGIVISVVWWIICWAFWMSLLASL